MNVATLCSRNLDRAQRGDSVREGAHRMLQRNVGTLVVFDDGDRPIGIVTDRDLTLKVLAKGLDPDTTNLGKVMTPEPAHVPASAEVTEALASMNEHRCRRLVVMDGAAVLGIISLDDVLRHFADSMRTVADLLEDESPSQLSRY